MAKSKHYEKRLNSLEGALEIDDNNLDGVVREHPVFFYEVGSLYAELVAWRDTAKDNLSQTRHTINLKVREESAAEGKKLTESNITALIETDGSVIEAGLELANAAELLGKVAALRDAFTQRSFAIRDIVSLTVHTHLTSSSINASSNEKYDDNRRHIEAHRKSKQGGMKKR